MLHLIAIGIYLQIKTIFLITYINNLKNHKSVSYVYCPESHWTYFMQILSNYNTKSLYHIENSVIKALKSDISHSYTCEINIGDTWLQFEKLKKLRQMALSYRNIKNKC